VPSMSTACRMLALDLDEPRTSGKAHGARAVGFSTDYSPRRKARLIRAGDTPLIRFAQALNAMAFVEKSDGLHCS
jgi:hypothetical protein